MKRLTFFDANEMAVIRRIVNRLQSEERLSPEQLRDLALSLEWALDQGVTQEITSGPTADARAEVETAESVVVPLDYAAAARAVHLHLQEFCRKDLRYPEMIAEAARQAGAEIEALRRRLAEPIDRSS